VEEDIIIRPKLAFAGLGWIGRNRLKAAVDTGYADISLLSDVSADRIKEAKIITHTDRSVSSFEETIADPDIDGVVIATPSALHAEQAIAAFKKNKAVFCQKPLGRNASEVKKVIEAAKHANRLLGVDFCYRYIAAFQRITHILRSGELGKVFAVDLKFHNAYGPDKPWFFDLKQSGGGCLLDLGIHLVDLMLYGLDFPELKKVNSHLYSKGLPVKGKNVVEDFADVHLEMENDTSVSLQCSWNLNVGCDAVIEASFYGTEGGLSMKNKNGSFYEFEALRYWGTKCEVIAGPPDDWGGRALVRWIRALAADTGFNKEAECFLPSAEIIDKIYER
jgi:predicted dehydrogenase